MSRYDAILERLRAATGPDRLLDGWAYREIQDDFNSTFVPIKDYDEIIIFEWIDAEPEFDGTDERIEYEVPRYTASIDAALALVEEKLPGWNWVLTSGSTFECCLSLISGLFLIDADKENYGNAITAPLAILIALFEALNAQEAGDV